MQKITGKDRERVVRDALKAALELLHFGVCGESVRYAQAVEESLEARKARRPRTLAEIRHISNRMMRQVAWLADCPVQNLGRRECEQILSCARTPRQQLKWRSILHGVLEHCIRQEWCSFNPVAMLAAPVVQEHELLPLSWEEIRRLVHTARLAAHRCCMPAMGLMLWAGIRPAEVERLRWSDIDWDEDVISLRPAHSKTGGTRHVLLHAVLKNWLRECGGGQGRICPANWQRHWRKLRDAAGIVPWRQDVLRHTFASYHVKHFHDFARLQEDMGHRSAALLRTRYLSMRGITRAHARLFWTPGGVGHT